MQVIGHCPDGVTHVRSLGDAGKVEGHVQPLTSLLAMSSDLHRRPGCVAFVELLPFVAFVELLPFVALMILCPKIGVARKRERVSGTQCS